MKRTNERTNERTKQGSRHVMDFSAVLAELRAQRETVATQLADLDEGIRILLKLHGGPEPAAVPAPLTTTRRSRATAPRTNGAAADAQSTKILDALRKAGGSASPGELVAATKLSYYVLGNRLTSMSATRQVVITGQSSGKRIALPGASAKEAP